MSSSVNSHRKSFSAFVAAKNKTDAALIRIFETSKESEDVVESLLNRVSYVVSKLPIEIRDDLLSDSNFRISIDDCQPGKGRTVLMPELNSQGSSRCVVLKPRLASCDVTFAFYIIAHEFAHAFLRNGGWGEIKDREEAADALAASWGFECPQRSVFPRFF